MLDLPILFDTWSQYLGACLILVLAEAVYVSFGFGAGLIAVGLLAWLLPSLQDVVILLLLLSAPTEFIVIARSRHAIEWAGFALILLGLVPGVLIGTRILAGASSLALLPILGVFLALSGAAFLIVPATRRIRPPLWLGAPAGALAGLLAAVFGTGGPPLILFYQLRGARKAAFRGTLMALFFAISLMRLPSCYAFGLITPSRIYSGLLVLPAVALGFFLGSRVHVRLSEDAFRVLVSVLLILLGINLLL